MRALETNNSPAFLGQLQDSYISCTFWILTSGSPFLTNLFRITASGFRRIRFSTFSWIPSFH